MTRLLGIETSCDETGIAVVENGVTILVNHVASQIPLHAQFGGVVPEIASRQHTLVISQMTRKALDDAGGAVDAIAATVGPGLIGSLLVGVSFARALAFAQGLPLIPIHHIEGHIFSPFLEGAPPQFPFLALIVSGGHTCLIQCPEAHRYQTLGATRDDAIGESFDKVARLLGLPYPGGPSIQDLARNGDPAAHAFPRGLAKSGTLEFSYSGLKTAVLYELRRNPQAPKADVAASFQAAAVDSLLIKTKLALRQTRAPRLVVAGGVAANQLLRDRLTRELDVPLHMPPIPLCADNGAMIAAAAHSRIGHACTGDPATTPSPNLPLH